jgi:hypothetical protein
MIAFISFDFLNERISNYTEIIIIRIMITVLEGKHEEEETIDLFITHTNHLLVHKWIENGILHSQFVVDNVRSRVTAMRDRGNYHILFINCKSELVYLRRHYDE